MTKVQARMLVPGSNRSCAAQALSSVSCTRSSARSGLPQRPRAKARKCGMTAVNSRLKTAAGDERSASGITIVELVQQLGEAVGERFLDDGIIESTEASRPVGVLVLSSHG